MSNFLRPHGLYSPWNSPGQNTRVGSISLLQEVFPTQGLNPGLPHAGGFFTSWATRETLLCQSLLCKSLCPEFSATLSSYQGVKDTLGTSLRTRLPMQETLQTRVLSLDREDPLEKETATHSSVLAWRILWTEGPRGLQSMGSQRVRQDWVSDQCSNGM